MKLTRRHAIVTLVLGLVDSPWRVSAQAPAKLPRVGYFGNQNPASIRSFLGGLEDAGYVRGRNVDLVFRGPDRPDKYEQFLGLAPQLVADGVSVIFAATPSAIEAAIKVTKTIPIVGVDLESDPVAKGWAATLAHPGGNFTGFVLDIPEMSGKQLQFLKELKPDLRRVAVLGDPRLNALQSRATDAAARNAGLTIHVLSVRSADDLSGGHCRGCAPA